jgi:hypothetical protein
MRSLIRTLTLTTLGVVLMACGASRGPARIEPTTTVRVENRGFSDMTIYVVQSSRRVRLGLATGNQTTVLKIPANMIFGMTELRFLADPIGGDRTPISESITVSPGEEVTLMITP